MRHASKPLDAYDGCMFVFSSVCTAAMWFVVRFVHDRLVPGARGRRERFWTITIVAAIVSASVLGAVFGALFNAVVGWCAAAMFAVTYVGLCVVLRALLGAFAAPDSWNAEQVDPD